jgi:transposase
LYLQQLAINAQLQKTIDEQAIEINFLKLNIINLNKLVFGGKQEQFKTDPNAHALQGTLFNGDQLGEVVTEVVKIVPAHITKKSTVRVNHHGRNALPASLRRVEIILIPNADITTAKKVGEEITEILEYQPGELFVKKYIRAEYIQVSADGLNAKRIIAPMPSLPIEKSYVGASLLAHLMVSKYMDHLPIFRQLSMFKRQGVTIADSTVVNWMRQGCTLLEPLFTLFEKKVLATNYLNVDETTLKVLDKTKKGTTHIGYYWVYYNTITNMVLFKYHPGRDGQWPRETLKNFQGHLQVDGYAAYEQFDVVKGIIVLCCWAHARRKFYDAQTFDKANCAIVLTEIQKLYELEKYCKDEKLTATEIQLYRMAHAKPILNNLLITLQAMLTKTTPKSPLGMAIQYTLNLWQKLNVYLTDGNLKIDNNLVENSIRPIAIGRKNYLFAGSQASAEQSAKLYSCFDTCKRHNKNPIAWLTYALENINDCKVNDLEKLLPQNYAG